LGFWACLTAPGENLYTLYFHGANYYATAIGNITCKVSLIQPSEYNLTFSGKQGIFTTKLISSGTPIPAASPELGRNLVNSLGSVVWESHSSAVSNLLAESIITLGVKSFGLPPYNRSEGYLRLYEAMIQGMFDYEATYVRLIYSTAINGSTPQSCRHPVKGSLDIDKFGWTSTRNNGAYLVPITLINLTTLVILVAAMRVGDKGKKLLPRFDPTDAEDLILSHDQTGGDLQTATARPSDPTPWQTKMAFGQNKDNIFRLWRKEEVVSPF